MEESEKDSSNSHCRYDVDGNRDSCVYVCACNNTLIRSG